MKSSNMLLNAALVGIVAAGTMGLSTAMAKGHAEKGHCVGANACKGKGGCKTEGANSCKGQNACKGKGFVEKTKAECDKMAKADPAVTFQAEHTEAH